jgi:Cellulase (glycosyl hydrolase family 5)
VLILALLAGCGASSGPPPLETVVQDDALLLYRSPAEVHRTARQLAALGVDRVRLTAGWSAIAPAPASPVRPKFDAADPATYPQAGWQRLDRAVREVEAAGMKPMIDVAFWAPRWAVQRELQPAGRQRYAPDPREFGLFARAAARRYPGVRLWTTWNEPNHPTFLMPQWVRQGGDWVPASPHLYRAMHERAYDAIKSVDPDNKVLMGGLASILEERPAENHGMPALLFLRELACVDARLEPLRRAECRGFRPLKADGFAIHPYQFTTAPDVRRGSPDSVTMANLADLSALLARLHDRGRIESRLRVYITEYGYETNPPDPFRGVHLSKQALWMSQATAIAHDRPDVAMFAQFLLRDVGPVPGAPPGSRKRWRGYQTGLAFVDGRPKPAVHAFVLPFFAGHGHAFGEVRPGSGKRRVAIDKLAPGRWRAGEEFDTGEDGTFKRALGGPGTYRFHWDGPDGRLYSAPVTVR